MARPRVLLIGEFSEGALALYYERAFEKAGWVTTRYDMWQGYARTPALSRSRMLRRALRPFLWHRMSSEVVARARRQQPELVVTFKGAFLGAGSVRELRRNTGGPVVVIYPDNPYGEYALRPDAISVLAEFDRAYIWGRFLVPRLQRDGVCSVRYLPFAHDPLDYCPGRTGPAPECGRGHPIVFIGQYYPKREEWLQTLAGHDVGIWGIGWRHARLAADRGFCVHREQVRGAAAGAVYAGARVGINILHAQNVPAHNMRTFEIPPCRTVMLSEATEEVAEFFPPGEACLDARTPADLRSQMDRLIQDPALAAALANDGRKRGQSHTYSDRVRAILQDLTLPAALTTAGTPAR